jgi:hypothetical protein
MVGGVRWSTVLRVAPRTCTRDANQMMVYRLDCVARSRAHRLHSNGLTMYDVPMRKHFASSILASLILFGCDESPGDELRDLACNHKFYSNGSSWVSACWPIYLESADLGKIDQMVNGGLLVPDEGDCYDATFADATLCVVWVDGHPLIGRPVEEVAQLIQADCPTGPGWSVFKSTLDTKCWADIGGVAVHVWSF